MLLVCKLIIQWDMFICRRLTGNYTLTVNEMLHKKLLCKHLRDEPRREVSMQDRKPSKFGTSFVTKKNLNDNSVPPYRSIRLVVVGILTSKNASNTDDDESYVYQYG